MSDRYWPPNAEFALVVRKGEYSEQTMIRSDDIDDIVEFLSEKSGRTGRSSEAIMEDYNAD